MITSSRVAAFPAVPQSVAAARQRISADVEDPDTARVVALLVSELVTTTLSDEDLRPTDTITIHTEPVDHGLRVTVCSSAAAATQDEPDADGRLTAGPTEIHRHGTPSGLGLKIVARMARRWGIASEHPGARAWFEVDDPS
ncbi:hypothetical protein DSM112329_04137 [Paraconexibacter sp. AEG42_29]|uniref:ATP-binding protein n=1 Tax=Paraconexibacter sp. AEG42_29 TaxID=2997339 RepID=A0AAU7AZS8_9ACTN